jgi:hypothetical protein
MRADLERFAIRLTCSPLSETCHAFWIYHHRKLGCGMRQILRLIMSNCWSDDDKNEILQSINWRDKATFPKTAILAEFKFRSLHCLSIRSDQFDR